ncbi:uncharacterized protein CYBJADRAFT_82506 [Cyberlindnera jadinii NRRL Y-1542]|uniref:Uncharacterized protein n=1 Tax=Cyberlindnera jadinii (strain ATCC 18201 / CBS 1600 / BCRC 20928 / JCM 3617 / NBRC 0987 / NRRL Y-1542) TaxID=983966 RepID=A0A1E4S3E1_CYBJN|nr:hypothetical protein CYBJADRAFT_82506 [Cyberlindnera jadinii NRRL Y-1542]ODV74046.1 hypothetical protein CYBJADRAFT_82506 [Cyberlindnera jadinii NRRL Y-1542]
MQFSAVIASLAAIASAAQIQLTANVKLTDYTGLSSIHEGAAINYFQVGGHSKDGFPFLQLAPQEQNVYWSVVDGKLVGYDADCQEVTFYAAKNVNDPYQYSKDTFFIGGTIGDKIDAYSVRQAESLQPVEIDVKYV